MRSGGSQTARARALVATGLRLADNSDLLSALGHWEQALVLDPELGAARLLIELTEAYLEALETGIELPQPDFRTHLAEIGYLSRESGELSLNRVPGTPRRAPNRRGRPQTPSGGAADPGAAAPRGADPRRTVYGLPLRETADSDEYTTPDPARPRYSAKEPPPASHRRPNTKRTRRPVPVDGPQRGARRGSKASDSGGPDPWADLSSELEQVSSGDWAIPGQSQLSAADSAPSRSGSWEASTGSQWPSSPPQTHNRRVSDGAGDGDGLPLPLQDPFAVLDDSSLRSRPQDTPQGGTHITAEGLAHRGPNRVSAGAPLRPPTQTESSPDLFDIFEGEDLPADPAYGGEPLIGSRTTGEIEVELLEEPAAADDELFDFELLDDDPDPLAEDTAKVPVITGDHLAPQREEKLDRARHHHELGDYSASERLLREVLDDDPRDRAARDLLGDNRRQREKSHLSRLRSVTATPRIVLGQEQLVWQNLDAKKGFVLSRVDGLLTVQDIIDISNLPRHETLQILADLVDEGILAVG